MIIKKISTGLATAALLTSLLAPVAHADTTVTVQGNGAGSNNSVHVANLNSTAVWQSNTTIVGTSISQSANTGGNDANLNTGGDVKIKTGDATNKALVTVAGGDNTVTLPDPCGCPSNTTVTVKNNGADSDNHVKVKNKNSVFVGQSSKTKVFTYIYQKANTGFNDANKNTGGDVKIKTGDAKNKAGVHVVSGDNTVN